MAALPSPTQVAGSHSGIYEAYYHQVDPSGAGAIQALDAARFLKKSRLSDVVLSKIWDLSDPTGKGYLDKAGLFVALKLVALAQAGKDINMINIHSETPPPKVGELPKVPPMSTPRPSPAPAPAPAGDWSLKPAERDKYSQLFESLQPTNGLIPGNKVKGVLMESKLPLETLGKIWDLADQDKDGMLDRHEFIVAMHLVYKALEKHAVPTTLPPELRARPSRPSRPASPAMRAPPPRPAPPPAAPAPAPAAPASNALLLEGLLDFSPPASEAARAPAPEAEPRWVVSAEEQAQYDVMFTSADADRDGFVSGAEIKQTFLNTGLPQQTLASIWALCDSGGAGKLSREQFALAMWFVKRALCGLAPPAALAPDMLPPSCRAPAARAPLAPLAPLAEPPKLEPALSLGPQPTPELEAVAREVDALARERLALEAELLAKQRELGVKGGEADGLQCELDTLSATLKQLENQKGEAQKRLNDLKSQVEKLRASVGAQEAAARETEAEVGARRRAAATLRDRERELQREAARRAAAADDLTAQLSRAVLALSQANIKVSHLEEQHRAAEEAAAALGALAPGAAAPHALLSLTPQHSAQHLERIVRGATPSDALEDEPFDKSDAFSSMNGSSFHTDPFKDGSGAALPAAARDPFAPAGNGNSGFGSDPFSKGFAGDAADPFDGDTFAADNNVNTDNKPAWEADPFAVLHAPTRGASPTPTLPPKKHKTPPPRPAPPRPTPPGAKSERSAAMDFTEDPFKDYRYEDPFDIADPFADAADPFARPASAPAEAAPAEAAPAWAAWPADAEPARAADAWAADAWGLDRNLNETWPATPGEKKSPKPVKYAKSLVHTIGGIGRSKRKKNRGAEAEPPSEERQWAWAAAESRRLEAEAERRRRREDADLQLALAISRRDK